MQDPIILGTNEVPLIFCKLPYRDLETRQGEVPTGLVRLPLPGF